MPVVDGHMHMPKQPGLGFELDCDRVQAPSERVESATEVTRAGSWRGGMVSAGKRMTIGAVPTLREELRGVP